MRSLPGNILFHKVNWFSVSEHQQKQMHAEILSLPENQTLNTSADDLCAYLVEKYNVDVPIIDEGGIHIEQSDIQIDVSRDPMRVFMDEYRGPIYVSGTKIEVTIPFSGDAGVFAIQPTAMTMSSPRAEIRGENLIMALSGTDLNADTVRVQIHSFIDDIKTKLAQIRVDAGSLKQQLVDQARIGVEQRRQKFLADRNLVASLGFPIKKRNDAPSTYRAPAIRRKNPVAPPAASTAAFKPEPALPMEEYEHILTVMENMALVMERSPSAFASIGEEDLRQHFLVQLNGQYEGQATGETFNFEGKTDILIRSGGKNIFIAECKYWGGPKKLLETIDQLLGYMSWRDTKAAVVIFNRQKDFTRVAEAILPTVREHPNFKRDLGRQSETRSRYVFAHRDDPNREMTLSILAFDVPLPAR